MTQLESREEIHTQSSLRVQENKILFYFSPASTMNYFFNMLMDLLVRKIEDSEEWGVDKQAQDIICNTKTYDDIIHFLIVNYDYAVLTHLEEVSAWGYRDGSENIQPIVFTNLFSCLLAMSHKHSKMKRILWKYRHLFVLEGLGSRRGYGELYLIDSLLTKELIAETDEFELLIDKLLKRRGSDNLDILLKIFRKITAVESC